MRRWYTFRCCWNLCCIIIALNCVFSCTSPSLPLWVVFFFGMIIRFERNGHIWCCYGQSCILQNACCGASWPGNDQWKELSVQTKPRLSLSFPMRVSVTWLMSTCITVLCGCTSAEPDYFHWRHPLPFLLYLFFPILAADCYVVVFLYC